MSERPDLPTPMGVFREMDLPSYDDLMHEQINLVKAEKGEGSLDVLLNSGETCEVK